MRGVRHFLRRLLATVATWTTQRERCTGCGLALVGYVHRGGSRGPGINDNYDWDVHDDCYDAFIARELEYEWYTEWDS